MRDLQGTPGAASMSLDTDAAQKQVTGVHMFEQLVVVKPRLPLQVIQKVPVEKILII